MAKVIDAVLYFNEIELFCARYDLLKDVVDRFCVFEAGCTFTGQQKLNDFWSDLALLNFHVDRHRICYLRVPEIPDQSTARANLDLSEECKRVALLGESGGDQWFKEHLSRELMKRTFDNVPDDTVVLISDIDEIPTPDAVYRADEFIKKNLQAIVSIPMRNFVGSISCDTGKIWEGTFAMTKSMAVETCLSMVRTLDAETGMRTYPGLHLDVIGGWHFSSFGGQETVARKIKAWGHQELNRWDIRWFLGANLAMGRDIFGRDLRGWSCRECDDRDLLNPANYFDSSKIYYDFICGHANALMKDWLLRGCFVIVQVVRRALVRSRLCKL